MGFFKNPLKAVSSFVADPVKAINNDMQKFEKAMGNGKDPQKVDACFDFGNSVRHPGDRKALTKDFLDSTTYAHCISKIKP